MSETIIIIIMGILLLIWVIVCGVQIFRHSRMTFKENDMAIHVQCENCGKSYDVTTGDFSSAYLSKYKSVTKTKLAGMAAVTKPQFTYYAKKFHCPHCRQKSYAQILNIDEIQKLSVSSVWKGSSKWLIAMVTGGFLILAVMGFSAMLASRYNDQKVNELKQERYEDLKNRYHFEDMTKIRNDKSAPSSA